MARVHNPPHYRDLQECGRMAAYALITCEHLLPISYFLESSGRRVGGLHGNLPLVDESTLNIRGSLCTPMTKRELIAK